MKQNVGVMDRLIRFTLVVLIVILYFSHIINGTVATVLLAIAAVFILTGMVSFCPLYSLLGISTKEKEQ